MSGEPLRKRDRVLAVFRKPARDALDAGATVQSPSHLLSGNGGIQSASIPSSTIPPHTIDPSQSFLTNALEGLSTEQRTLIQTYVTSDVSSTVQAAYDAAQKQKTVCETERWSSSDKADNVLLWLDRFKAVEDIAANADPIHVGLPRAVIRLLLKAAVTDSREMTALVSGMDLALRMSNRSRAYFAYFQSLTAALTTDNFRKALIALYIHILQFLAKAIKIYSTNPVARKFEAFWQDSDLTAFSHGCNELGKSTDIEANNCDREVREMQWTAAKQWKTELDTELQADAQIQGIQTFLDALHNKVDLSRLPRVMGATFNAIEDDQSQYCHEQTRVDLLNQIAEWTKKPDGKCIFWLCGMAGTEKSTISRTVAQTLHIRGRLGASFFSNVGIAVGATRAASFQR